MRRALMAVGALALIAFAALMVFMVAIEGQSW